MVLHNEIDPLPSKRIEKTKKFTKYFSKIKIIFSKSFLRLANAIFLLGKHSSTAGNSSLEIMGGGFLRTKNFFAKVVKLMPHVSIALVAVLVVASNLIVKYARADFSMIYPDPANEIAFASMVDPYTPLISQDGIAADSAYQNSGGAFVALNGTVDTNITQREEPLPDNSSATITYVVKDGDTLTSLGWKFGVKLATLTYFNDLENENLVKPGQKLKIPPKGYEVSASQLAKKERERQLASASRNTVTRSSSRSQTTASSVNHAPGSSKNGYPYGYCTYYVATRRYVPSSWGNAKAWLSSASRAGYSTGSQPAVGSIVVTAESWWGHVAYVESVNGGNITIAEMNAVGWGKISRRTISAYGGVVRGYIY